MKNNFLLLIVSFVIFSCSSPAKKTIPVIGFLDFMQDETLEKAKHGFVESLKSEGFDENKKTVEIIYRNAQGDQTALVQSCDYLISQEVNLIATNPTLSTITAIQKTKSIPVFMMVSPRPDLAGLTDASGKYPGNLFGVFETLDYIDTSLMLIKKAFPTAKRVGTIFNQSEPQSVDALYEIQKSCKLSGLELVKLPVNSSNETQLVVQSLLTKNIDAFFALPDNTVFSSIEIIVRSCDEAKVPVFTSEEGLVKRGALAAFGADMYQWGWQAGKQAALFLKNKSTQGIKPEIVQARRRVYNPVKAELFKVTFDSTFKAVK